LQVIQLGDAEAGLAHHVPPDGVGEGQPLGLDLGEHAGVDGLEVDVPDAVGVLADEPRRVPVGVGDVPGVEAETHPFGIGVGQEPADLLIGLDVALGMRVEHEPDAGLVAQDAGEVVGAVGERAPLAGVEVGRLQLASVGQVPVHGRQEHHIAGPERAGQARNFKHLSLDGGQLGTLVQRAAHGPAGQAQPAGCELGAQRRGVGRQVAVRAELQPFVSGPGDLVQEAGPRRLAGIVREPDAPRVGGAADAEPRPRRARLAGRGKVVAHCWPLRSSFRPPGLESSMGAFPLRLWERYHPWPGCQDPEKIP